MLGELGQEASGEMARIFMQAATTMSLPREYLVANVPTLVDAALDAVLPWVAGKKKSPRSGMNDPAAMKEFYEKMVAAKNRINKNRDENE